MNDLYAALAAERASTLIKQAQDERLVRLARCCTPSGIAVGISRVRAVGRASLHWLRQGQLAGNPSHCC